MRRPRSFCAAHSFCISGLCCAQNGHQLAHQYSTSTRPSACAGTKRPPDYVRAVATDDVADLLAGRLDALLRPGPGPYPGLHAEVLALAPGFGAHKKASLVVWPGLARCREFTRTRALLVKD